MDRRQLQLMRAVPLLAAMTAATPAGAAVYQWKDAEGRVHFSDQSPDNRAAPVIGRGAVPATSHKTDLDFSLVAHGRPLPEDIRVRAEAGIREMVRIYRQTLRLEIRRTVVISAHLFDDQDALRQWASGIARQRVGNVLGIYLVETRQVGVINFADDPEQTLKTLIHEANHVILAQMSPRSPLWLHEGLSQYFEGLDIGNEKTVVRPHAWNDQAIRRLAADKQLIYLHDYLAIPPDRWQQIAHQEQNALPYVVAWSLASFLMSQPNRRQLLAGMMKDLETANIPPDLDTFARRYPGGLPLLEYDWFKWAMQPAVDQRLD
ncbi:MAG: DUF4124 domain-containing protein [Pseudomonadota bacterium]